jgi:hypothetical protein
MQKQHGYFTSRSPLHDNSSDERQAEMLTTVDWWGWQCIIIFAWKLKLKHSIGFVTEMLTTHAYDRLPKRVCHLSKTTLQVRLHTARVVQAHGLAFATNSSCLRPGQSTAASLPCRCSEIPIWEGLVNFSQLLHTKNWIRVFSGLWEAA